MQKTSDIAAASSCLNPLKYVGCWRPQAFFMRWTFVQAAPKKETPA